MRNWLDKADVAAAESRLVGAKLAEDMRPLTAQYQMASDSAKNGVARLAGIEIAQHAGHRNQLRRPQGPLRPDHRFRPERSRPQQLEGSETRDRRDPQIPQRQWLSLRPAWAISPNSCCPISSSTRTTAYAILRAQGIAIGKPDFLAHMGMPNIVPPAETGLRPNALLWNGRVSGRLEPRPHELNTVSFGYREVAPEEKTKLVGGVFSSVAKNYDLMNDAMSGGLHRLWKDLFVRRVKPRAGETILDMAGGTGDIAFRMAPRRRAESRSADINEDMLAVGMERAEEARHPGPDLEAAKCRGR